LIYKVDSLKHFPVVYHLTSNKKQDMSKIEIGDLVTLRGMKKQKEKPIGMVKRIWATKDLEIFWLNEDMANRFALVKILDAKKLEVVSKAHQ